MFVFRSKFDTVRTKYLILFRQICVLNHLNAFSRVTAAIYHFSHVMISAILKKKRNCECYCLFYTELFVSVYAAMIQ